MNGTTNTTNTTTARPTSRQQVNTYKATPVPTYRGAKLIALSALEDTFIFKLKESGVTQDAREAYAKYQKLKALALAPSNNSATQNEADAALRMAVIHLVKLAF